MGTQAEFEQVMRLIFANRVQVTIDDVFALRDYPQALARMMTDDHFGKLVVEIN
jgi:NADPH:quinone reductase-like Zn-dependent oxidoreductase